jgi:excisionase family DNA binding protein
MDKLIAIKEAAELLGVDPKTLRRWESDGKISPQKTIGGHRRYLLSEIEAMQGFEDEEQTDDMAIYCRVSSHEQKQKGDLDRQQARLVKYCAEKDYKVKYIYDEVGSGMSTGDDYIVERADWDSVWGDGPNRCGKNQLGRLWIKVRGEFRKGWHKEPI